jgi:hypothetical protein
MAWQRTGQRFQMAGDGMGRRDGAQRGSGGVANRHAVGTSRAEGAAPQAGGDAGLLGLHRRFMGDGRKQGARVGMEGRGKHVVGLSGFA